MEIICHKYMDDAMLGHTPTSDSDFPTPHPISRPIKMIYNPSRIPNPSPTPDLTAKPRVFRRLLSIPTINGAGTCTTYWKNYT